MHVKHKVKHDDGQRKDSDELLGSMASSLSVIDFKQMSWPVMLLPFTALWTCFLIAMTFQFDEVNDTMCDIKNSIPSISAICSTVPNRYIWRIAVALHITPRLYIGKLYYNFYLRGAHSVPNKYQQIYKKMVMPNLLLYLTENFCLMGTAYINNREDYPVHEKLFIVYMGSTILHMAISCVMFAMSKYKNNYKSDQLSLMVKCVCLAVILLATVGLLYYYYKHRVYCEEGAFSWFAFWEYWIAMSNTGFHLTCNIDFADYQIVFMHKVRVKETKNSVKKTK